MDLFLNNLFLFGWLKKSYKIKNVSQGNTNSTFVKPLNFKKINLNSYLQSFCPRLNLRGSVKKSSYHNEMSKFWTNIKKNHDLLKGDKFNFFFIKIHDFWVGVS